MHSFWRNWYSVFCSTIHTLCNIQYHECWSDYFRPHDATQKGTFLIYSSMVLRDLIHFLNGIGTNVNVNIWLNQNGAKQLKLCWNLLFYVPWFWNNDFCAVMISVSGILIFSNVIVKSSHINEGLNSFSNSLLKLILYLKLVKTIVLKILPLERTV